MSVRIATGVLALSLALLHSVSAQGYRLRIDSRLQAVSFRGVTLDSIAVTDTATGPGGGPATMDGYAVTCLPGDPFCHYYRPGPVHRVAPLATVADLTLWGFGVPGLSARVAARFGFDFGDADVWPGSDPAVQLLEGYVEYASPRATARIGRLLTTSRLGYEGFDGGQIVLRDGRRGLELNGYAGWGLSRGVALPVTSPALNPLDDFQPRRRQIVAGAGAGWTTIWFDARVDYLREVDPEVDYFVSERVGVQAVVHPATGVTVQGGSDWDLAAGSWGSAEASVGYASPRVNATLGARRYHPHFALWTIWGAFSPVPYHATFGQVGVRAAEWLDLRARVERYGYEPAAVSTALVQSESDGWRWELGGTATVVQRISLDAGYHAEFGPGASSAGFAGSIAYAPRNRMLVTLRGSTLQRPLEFRFNESKLWTVGIEAQADATQQLTLGVGAVYYDERRHRPDAAAFDWNQVRLTARAVLLLGNGADLRGLPPAVRRLTRGREAQ